MSEKTKWELSLEGKGTFLGKEQGLDIVEVQGSGQDALACFTQNSAVSCNVPFTFLSHPELGDI